MTQETSAVLTDRRNLEACPSSSNNDDKLHQTRSDLTDLIHSPITHKHQSKCLASLPFDYNVKEKNNAGVQEL